MEAYAPIRVVNGGGSSRMEAYAPIRVVTGGGSSQMEPLAAIRVARVPDSISIWSCLNPCCVPSISFLRSKRAQFRHALKTCLSRL